MSILRFLFLKIYLPITIFIAKICHYRIKPIPFEILYPVDIKYNEKSGDVFRDLAHQIIDDSRRKYKDSRADLFTFITKYLEDADKLNEVFAFLSDEESKKTYFDIVKFRLTYWIFRMEPKLEPSYTLKTPKYPIPKLIGEKGMVKQCIDKVYYHSQYEIPGLVEIDKGDVVIDAGAFYGDSAIYFDSANSPGGTVYAFEPNKNIVTILRDNIRLNKTTNIVVVEKGLSDSDSIVKLTDTGETSVIFDANTVDTGSFMEIETTTIDNFVAINGLKKVNFIKMDIEGHEECAIKGGRETIKQFKPKLAISIYHRYYDVYDLPLLIREINPDYKFYIRHATNTWADTVLFCI